MVIAVAQLAVVVHIPSLAPQNVKNMKKECVLFISIQQSFKILAIKSQSLDKYAFYI